MTVKRAKFWKVVKEAADFMIDMHQNLTELAGAEAADISFGEALEASNILAKHLAKLPSDQQLNASVNHVAFAIAALWLDFESAGVVDVIQKQTSGQPWEGGLSN